MYLTNSERDFLNELSIFLWSLRYSETFQDTEELERLYMMLNRLLGELDSRHNRSKESSYEQIKRRRKVDKNYARKK